MANMSTITSRRAVLAGIAAAPALAGPALALSGSDPIYAAIDRYHAAVAARLAALDATWQYNANLAHLPEDAPECVAAEAIHDAAADRQYELLDKLLATQPTTVSGVAALLEKLAAGPYWELVPGIRAE